MNILEKLIEIKSKSLEKRIIELTQKNGPRVVIDILKRHLSDISHTHYVLNQPLDEECSKLLGLEVISHKSDKVYRQYTDMGNVITTLHVFETEQGAVYYSSLENKLGHSVQAVSFDNHTLEDESELHI